MPDVRLYILLFGALAGVAVLGTLWLLVRHSKGYYTAAVLGIAFAGGATIYFLWTHPDVAAWLIGWPLRWRP